MCTHKKEKKRPQQVTNLCCCVCVCRYIYTPAAAAADALLLLCIYPLADAFWFCFDRNTAWPLRICVYLYVCVYVRICLLNSFFFFVFLLFGLFFSIRETHSRRFGCVFHFSNFFLNPPEWRRRRIVTSSNSSSLLLCGCIYRERGSKY